VKLEISLTSPTFNIRNRQVVGEFMREYPDAGVFMLVSGLGGQSILEVTTLIFDAPLISIY
jgi:hypothetical protein